jgi:hypothetical protein
MQGASVPEEVESRAKRVLLAAGCAELAVADALEALRLVGQVVTVRNSIAFICRVKNQTNPAYPMNGFSTCTVQVASLEYQRRIRKTLPSTVIIYQNYN